jgi:hypothetical protein
MVFDFSQAHEVAIDTVSPDHSGSSSKKFAAQLRKKDSSSTGKDIDQSEGGANMRKISCVVAVLGTIIWSGAALAVFQETSVTITDNGKPIPNATVTLTSVTPTDSADKKQEKPHPKTVKTDENGTIVFVHDEEDKKSSDIVEVTIKADDGKTLTRRATTADLLANIPFDVSKNECADPRLFTDTQLRTLLDNPEMRTRITTLIDESEKAERKKRANEQSHKKKHKTRNATERRRRHRSADNPPPANSDADAAAAIATDVIIGIGIGAIGSHGGGRHGGERRNQWRHEGGQNER